MAKKTDSWLANGIKFGLEKLKTIGGPLSFQVRDVSIREKHIELGFTSKNPSDKISILKEFVALMGFFHGFFLDGKLKDITEYKISALAYDKEKPLICVTCDWEAIKSAGLGNSLSWLNKSKFEQITTQDLQMQANLTLFRFENFIRDYIRSSLEKIYGYMWYDKAIPSKFMKKIRDRTKSMSSIDSRTGSGGILRHLDFPDYKSLINMHWDRVYENKIWDKNDFNKQYTFLEKIRIALGHNHPLTEKEAIEFENTIDLLFKKLM